LAELSLTMLQREPQGRNLFANWRKSHYGKQRVFRASFCKFPRDLREIFAVRFDGAAQVGLLEKKGPFRVVFQEFGFPKQQTVSPMQIARQGNV
jgi:hypothetical protein